jgi:hypothetical protein
VRAYATRTGLAGHTRNSITQLPALERELAKARQYGIARDNEELELGVRCMAAGIYDDQGGWSRACRSRRRPTGWTRLAAQAAGRRRSRSRRRWGTWRRRIDPAPERHPQEDFQCFRPLARMYIAPKAIDKIAI